MWEVKKIKDVCQVIAGQSPQGKYYNSSGEGLPFYQGKKEYGVKYIGLPTKWTSKVTKVALEGDVLMSVRAPVGPINFSTQKICIGRGLAAIRPLRSIDKDFLYYYLMSIQTTIQGSEGAVFSSINKKQIENIEFPYTDIDNQKIIVAKLDQAFAEIEKAKANAEQNLNNARELFESYLHQQFNEHASGDDSEALDTICDLIVDCEHKTAPTQDEGFPSIRTPNIGQGVLILDNVKRVSEETYKTWTKRAVPQADDLILAREAPAGNIAVIPQNLKVCLGQRTVLIRPKRDKLVSKYLAFLILSKDVQKQLLFHSKGATVGHINMKDIRAFKIYNLPSLAEQSKVVCGIESISTEIKKLENIYAKKVDSLAELKQSILQKAFNGELA
jgi:type I restriction enzyme S subunit